MASPVHAHVGSRLRAHNIIRRRVLAKNDILPVAPQTCGVPTGKWISSRLHLLFHLMLFPFLHLRYTDRNKRKVAKFPRAERRGDPGQRGSRQLNYQETACRKLTVGERRLLRTLQATRQQRLERARGYCGFGSVAPTMPSYGGKNAGWPL